MMNPLPKFPPWQQTVRAKCVHPAGGWIKFETSEIEQAIPTRFEQQVLQHPHRLALKFQTRRWSYTGLNEEAIQLFNVEKL